MNLRAQAPDLYTGKMDRYWLLIVILTIITKGIIYIVAGITLSIVSIAAALINKRYKQGYVKYFLGYGRELTSQAPYATFLSAIAISKKPFTKDVEETGDGLILQKIRAFFEPKLEILNSSPSFLKRHLITRVIFPIYGITMMITHLFNSCIGAIAIVTSLLLLGCCTRVDDLALQNCNLFNILEDTYLCILGTVHPKQAYRIDLEEFYNQSLDKKTLRHSSRYF